MFLSARGKKKNVAMVGFHPYTEQKWCQSPLTFSCGFNKWGGTWTKGLFGVTQG